VKGQTPIVFVPGTRQSVSAASAANAKGGFWCATHKGGMNAKLFIALLKAMMLLRKKPVFLILDSLPAHKAKVVQDYVASTEGKLEFHFLPGYAPELNPDDRSALPPQPWQLLDEAFPVTGLSEPRPELDSAPDRGPPLAHDVLQLRAGVAAVVRDPRHPPGTAQMKVSLKITGSLLDLVRRDLARPHFFTHERVGFLTAGAAVVPGGLMLVVRGYMSVADEDYEVAPKVGARIGSNAMRKAAQSAYRPASTLLHVDIHGGRGPSRVQRGRP
jgi:hypothetical protein